MKKAISIILAITVLTATFPFYAYAKASDKTAVSDKYKKIVGEYDTDKAFMEGIVLTEGENSINLNGDEVAISADERLCPEMSDENKLMVPAETLCRYISADYTENETGYDTITYEDRTLTFDAECGAYALSEERVDDIFVFDSIPYEKNGKIMLPANEVSDALGYECYEEDNSVLLTRPYQTCRLLVSTTKTVDELNSVESVRDQENNITILQFETETDTIAASEYYENLKNVSSVEPDTIFTLCDEEEAEGEEPVNINDSDDLIFTDDGHMTGWGRDYVGVDDLNDYLATQSLNDILVAVVDTGVCSTHEKLKSRIICAPVNYSDSGAPNSSEDDNGHGTHVTGIVTDNTLDNVTVLDVKVLNANGQGTLYQVYEGMQYAVSQGVKAINLSLGAAGKSELLEKYIKKLRNKNISVIVAAGNSDRPAAAFTPAGIEECITVANMCLKGWPVKVRDDGPYSNYDWPIDIYAPGTDIYSTYIYDEDHDGYATLTGTSMAAPFVTAAVSMMLSFDNSYTTDYMEYRIRHYGIMEDSDKLYNRDWKHWTYNELNFRNLIDIDRTATPTANIDTWYFEDVISVELSCEEEAEIYYTLDGTVASKGNGELYTEPITIDTVTRLHFVAYADGKFKSIQEHRDYYIALPANEEDFTIDDNGTITAFTGVREDNRYMSIPENIRGVTVTAIGESVFRLNKALRMLILPETCKTIGAKALENCTALALFRGDGVEVIGNNAFNYCQSMTDAILPRLKVIGKYSFGRCHKMNSFSNDLITEIPDYGFYMSYGLRNVNLPNVTSIGRFAFASCQFIQHFSAPKTEIIKNNAFQSVRLYMQHFSFPNCTSVWYEAFRGCTKLISVDIENAGEIGNRTFQECINLQSVNMPSVTSIGIEAFKNCKSLSKVDFPNVITVMRDAFYGCGNIKIFRLDRAETVRSVGYGFESLYLPNCKLIEYGFGGYSLKYVYLPKVTEISKGKLNSPNLESVYMPLLERVDGNGSGEEYFALFNNCYKLKVVDLPNLTEISKAYLFRFTDESQPISLKYLNIPNYQGDTSRLFYKMSYDYIPGKAPNDNSPIFDNEGNHKLNISSSTPFYAFCDDKELVPEESNGQYNINTSVPSGSYICLNVQGDNFEAWLDDRGRVKSVKSEYHFVSGDDVSLSVKFKDAGYVNFYNANGDLICSNPYTKFTENDYPDVPDYYGHSFIGWSMTVEEINELLQNEECVCVTALFEKNIKYYSVNISGGYVSYTDSDNYNGDNSYRELSLIKIKPDYTETTPFAYWANSDGEVLSYNADFSFYVSNDINIHAVYSDYEFKHQPLVRITNAVPDKDSNIITFIAQREIPNDCTVISHGIILTNNSTLNEDTFIIGADGVLKGTSNKTGGSGTYTLFKSNVNVGDTWYARGYVNYKTADGKVKTIYSDIASCTMEE